MHKAADKKNRKTGNLAEDDDEFLHSCGCSNSSALLLIFCLTLLCGLIAFIVHSYKRQQFLAERGAGHAHNSAARANAHKGVDTQGFGGDNLDINGKYVLTVWKIANLYCAFFLT